MLQWYCCYAWACICTHWSRQWPASQPPSLPSDLPLCCQLVGWPLDPGLTLANITSSARLAYSGDGYRTDLPTKSLFFLLFTKTPPQWCWVCAQLLPPYHKHHHFARSSIALHYCYTSAYTRDREKKPERCCQAWWLSLCTVLIHTGLHVKWWQRPVCIKGTYTVEILCFIDNVCMLLSHSSQESPPLCLLLPLMFFKNYQSLVTVCMCYLSSFPYHAWHIHLTLWVFPHIPAQKGLVASPRGTCSALFSRRMHWTQWELGKFKARCQHFPFQKIFLVRRQQKAMCRRNSGPTCDLAQSIPGLLYTDSSAILDLSPSSQCLFCTLPLHRLQNGLFQSAADTLYPTPAFHCWYFLKWKPWDTVERILGKPQCPAEM